MAGTSMLTAPDAERQPFKVFTGKAYLDYSMYVILTGRCRISATA
jgi:hypothetical protein